VLRSGQIGRTISVALLTLTAACKDAADETAARQSGTIVQTDAASPTTRPTAPIAVAPISTDRVERATVPPKPDLSPPVQPEISRTFVDPPLPPELLDDGGLIPLPKPKTSAGER
jgi:hypothetical protein